MEGRVGRDIYPNGPRACWSKMRSTQLSALAAHTAKAESPKGTPAVCLYTGIDGYTSLHLASVQHIPDFLHSLHFASFQSTRAGQEIGVILARWFCHLSPMSISISRFT